MWLHSPGTQALAFISPGIATAASCSRRAAAAVSFRRHRSYGFGAPAAAALFARRLIWLVCLVGLVCLIGLVYLVGLFVGWSIGLSGWSGVCGLGSVGLVCLDEVWTGGWSVWLAWSVYCCVCRPVGLGHDRRDSWRFSN